MNVTIDNHRWLQDPKQTKSALCFERADLPAEWPEAALFDFVRFEAVADEADPRWVVTLNTGEAEHQLVFPVHIQILLGQAKMYTSITLVVLDENDHWVKTQLVTAPAPANAPEGVLV